MTIILRGFIKSALLLLLIMTGTIYAEDAYEVHDALADFYGDEEFVSIATGRKKAVNKAPAVTSVITAEDIKAMGARNISEVLDSVPGIHVSRSGQNLSPEIWFRGITSTFNPQTLLMINGVSTKSVVRGDNHTVWGEFPIHAIERIEIIRGPGSALYGADAFSGVINIITKKNSENQKNEVGAMLGSFATSNVWANHQLQLDSWRLNFNFEFLKSAGFDGIIEIDTQSAFDSFGAGFGAQPASLAPGKMATSFEATDLWISANNSLMAFELGLQNRANVGTGQGGTEALDSIGRLENYKHILKTSLKEIEIFESFYIAANLSHYSSSQEIEKNMVLFPSGAFFGAFPDGFIGNPGWKEETTHFELASRFEFSVDTEFSLGIGYERQNVYQVTEQKNFNPDFTPRANGLVDVSDTAEIFMPETDRESNFLYFQDITQLARDWELTAGVRYDDYTDFGSVVNPRVALVWSASQKLTTKFLYGKAFRAPAFAELVIVNNPIALGNPNLKPETIDTYELAFVYNYSPELSTSFNFFSYQIEDFITFVPDVNGATSTAQNLGERKGRGFETSLQYDLTPELKLIADFTYVKAKDSIAAQNVGDYPEFQGYVRGEWTLNDHWKLNGHISSVGERSRVPGDTREKLDGYSQVNVISSYRSAADSMLFELIVTNLFDEDIREPSSSGITFGAVNIPNDIPQAGRGLYLRLSSNY